MYSIKLQRVYTGQGQLEESKKYQKEALGYLPFTNDSQGDLTFKP
jgi:hypothetical protein